MIRFIQGDAAEVLATLPADSVHMCVTSPPYYALRDYGTAKWECGDVECDHSLVRRNHNGDKQSTQKGSSRDPVRSYCRFCGARRIDKQIGMEQTPAAYIANLVAVFRQVRRVLRPDGTLWLNLGDSRKDKQLLGMPWRVAFALQDDGWILRDEIVWSKANCMPESVTDRCTRSHEQIFMLAKSGDTTFWTHRDLPGVRSQPEPDYRWVHKKTGEETAVPQSGDEWRRVNLWRGHDYFWDSEAVKEPCSETSHGGPNVKPGQKNVLLGKVNGESGALGKWTAEDKAGGRNIRSVWHIASEPSRLQHYAAYPTKLVVTCIKAGTSERGVCQNCLAPYVRVIEKANDGTRDTSNVSRAIAMGHDPRGPTAVTRAGEPRSSITLGFRQSCSCQPEEPIPATVLDCFAGSGTTGLVADRLQRNAILIDISDEYERMARTRIQDDAPLFAQVV